jgi:hypothetical protein
MSGFMFSEDARGPDKTEWVQYVEIHGVRVSVIAYAPANHHTQCVLQQAFCRLERVSDFEKDVEELRRVEE